MLSHRTAALSWLGTRPDELRPDRPNLVLIHGSGGSGRFWAGQLAGLTGRCGLLAVDLPGHGQSPGPALDRVEGYAAAVLALVEALDLGRPWVGGMSLGGAVAMQLLADHPARFGGGLLLSTGAKLKVRTEIFAAIEADFEATLSLVGQLGAGPGSDPALVAQVVADMRACGPGVVSGDFRACDAFDLRGRIPTIEVPCLVLCGDRDLLTPPGYSDWLAEHLPRATRVAIADAGHFAALERSAAVNAAIEQMLLG